MAVLNTHRYRKANYSIRNTTAKQLPLNRARIIYIIRETLRRQGIASAWSISVAFVSDSAIKKVNRKYLLKAGATDVLSFGYGKACAELVISLDTAKRNAKVYRTSIKKEITLYIIHGLLHLLGYDDRRPAQRIKMRKRQEELLWLFSKQRQLS